MSITNNLKKQIDLPVFEWTRFAPLQSSAISCTCTADNSNLHFSFGKYIYYLIGATSFWRYDTYSDTYLQLSSPPITPVTWSSMRFASGTCTISNILSATSTTALIPAYFGKTYKGFDISIIAGTGAGQRRTIVDVSDSVVQDIGVATTVTNALGGIAITDTLKSWAINQWAGYQVRIVSGSGVGQVRRILYNSATVLTVADSTVSGSEILCNPMIYSPAISSTAGSQSVYQIEASNVTVDTAWLTTPDTTSRYTVHGGNIYLFSSAAATPFYTVQRYDVLTDTWYIHTSTTLTAAAVGTDGTVEKSTEGATVWERTSSVVSGTSMTSVVSGTNTTLQDSGKSWVVNQWAGYYVRFWSGSGEGQISLISSNTSNTLTFASVTTAPTGTTQYFIEGFDAGTASSGSTTTIVDSTKSWAVNRWRNYMIKCTFGTGKGQTALILSNTSTTLTFIKPVGTAFDSTSVYTIIGDIDKLYLSMGGNTAILVYNISDDLESFGRLNDSGIASNGSVQFGSNRPIAIASLSNSTTTATVTTAINHFYKVGQSVVVKGATDANYNGTFTITTVASATTFTYTMGGTPASSTLVNSQSITTLSDASKSWTTNQWAGYIVYMNSSAVTAASGLATGQALQIASNTATTLTFISGTAPTNGVSRYIITPRDAIGNMFSGIATGTQSTTLLTDTNVSAFSGTCSTSSSSNILTVSAVSAGYLGIGSVVSATGITAGTIIIAFGPNTNGGVGTYIMSNTVTITGTALTSSGWAVNFFAGRKLKLIGSTGQSQEISITSNTATALTTGTLTTAPVTAVTSYVILQQPTRGTGIELNWVYGTSDPNLKGKRFYVARGGAAIGFDYFDVTTDKFELASITPQAESLTTGSMYAYDGGDRMYFTKEITQRLYYLDLVTNNIHGAGLYPYSAGTAIIGNRMEIFSTIDNLKYLWLNRHSQFECFRALLFY